MRARETGVAGGFLDKLLGRTAPPPADVQAVVQELVGHDSVQMSQQYTHVGIEALQKAAAALPEL